MDSNALPSPVCPQTVSSSSTSRWIARSFTCRHYQVRERERERDFILTIGMRDTAWKNLARLFAVITALVISHVQVSEGLPQKCYVCVPGAGGSAAADLQAMFPGEKTPLPKCDDFHTDDPRFIKTCPVAFEGCITQTNGSQVTRTCGDFPVNDCKIANHIKYCYCSGQLCNGEPTSPLGVADHPDATDDEDLNPSEGSGSGGGDHRHRETSHQHRQRVDVTTPSTTLRLATPITTTAATTAKSGAASAIRGTDAVRKAVVGVLCLVVLGGRW